MLNNTKDKLITILIHVLVWGLLIFVLFMYPPLAGTAIKLPGAFWVKQAIHIALLIFAFYFTAYYLVPKLLLSNKTLLFVSSLLCWCLFSGLLLNRVDAWLNLSRQLERAFGKKMWPKLHVDFFGLMTTLFILGISIGISLVQHWHRDAKMRQEFESNRTVAELAFLKAQINPHFFFNTLNSIYALTYINVDTSREALYKLSHMMRYLLYETQRDSTLLSKEIGFIKDYIGIMKLRLRENTLVVLNVPDELIEMPVAPMLFLPFIENAFKHGVDDQQTSTISVDMAQTAQGLVLKVSNSIFQQPDYPENETEEKGIGLVNTKRRLDLLYKDKYTLTVVTDEKAAKHEVNLELTLV